MSKLREKTIQLKALEELRKFYSKKENNEVVFAAPEVRTRKEKGNKRADGLICFKINDQEIFTVSLEAKSHKTHWDLTSFISDDKLALQSIIISIVLSFIAVASLILFSELRWYFIGSIGLAILIGSIIAAFWLLDKLDLDNHKVISVIEQLKQYPANQQWIAISSYTDNLLNNVSSTFKKNHLELLDSLCKKNGFGLILIGNKTAKIMYEPKIKKGYFLNNYSQEEKIRQYLM